MPYYVECKEYRKGPFSEKAQAEEAAVDKYACEWEHEVVYYDVPVPVGNMWRGRNVDARDQTD